MNTREMIRLDVVFAVLNAFDADVPAAFCASAPVVLPALECPL